MKKKSTRTKSAGRTAAKARKPIAAGARPAKSGAARSAMIPAEKLAAYEALVATRPEAERKGDKIPYTAVNGHMFSSLDGDGNMALRLSESDRAAFVAQYETKPVIAYGIVRKDYVAVPAALLRNTRELKRWFDKSLEHVRSLKPKPTTKPRKT
jgi:hypothetical protein